MVGLGLRDKVGRVLWFRCCDQGDGAMEVEM